MNEYPTRFSEKTENTRVPQAPGLPPSLSRVSASRAEPLWHWEVPLPHTQQKACRKIPKCRRDGHAWKHLSYADIRMVSQSRAAGSSAPNIVTRSAFSQRLWLRLHRLQVLQLLHTHFSIPRMAGPVWGWEEGTPRAQRMVGNAVDRAASLQADSTHSSLSLAALKAVRGLAGRGSVWRPWPQPRHVEILAPSQQ